MDTLGIQKRFNFKGNIEFFEKEIDDSSNMIKEIGIKIEKLSK